MQVMLIIMILGGDDSKILMNFNHATMLISFIHLCDKTIDLHSEPRNYGQVHDKYETYLFPSLS